MSILDTLADKQYKRHLKAIINWFSQNKLSESDIKFLRNFYKRRQLARATRKNIELLRYIAGSLRVLFKYRPVDVVLNDLKKHNIIIPLEMKDIKQIEKLFGDVRKRNFRIKRTYNEYNGY